MKPRSAYGPTEAGKAKRAQQYINKEEVERFWTDREVREGHRVLSPRYNFDKWKHHIGVENLLDEPLTVNALRRWADDPNRRVECIFCGETYPPETMACRRCREYKGIQPYIEGWSNWD